MQGMSPAPPGHPETKGTAPKKIEDWTGVTRAVFDNENLPANQPAVPRGLLRCRPAVQAGCESRTSVVALFEQSGSKAG